jgi:acyl carrier protein
VGDALTSRDVHRLRRLAPALTCVNYYGTTETQRAVAYHVVPNQEPREEHPAAHSPLAKEALPLGRGIKDVQLLVLNSAQQLAGIGEKGEIYLRSPHLARGYVGDETLSRERFIVNPFTGRNTDRLYRSGDLGRYLPDGNVESLGRNDYQLKLRGFRIEPKEIEAVLNRHGAVRESVVIAREDVPGDKRLAAYLVLQPPHTAPAVVELRLLLKSALPDYMIPSSFIFLDTLPLTPNGKLDRRALPAPAQFESQAGPSFLAPRNRTEELLAASMAEVLNRERVGVHDNFFELGGHSLSAMQVVGRLRQLFELELPLRSIFEAPTVEQLAVVLVQLQAVEANYTEMDALLAELDKLSEEDVSLLIEDESDWRQPV